MTMDVYQRTIRADSSPPISVDDFRDLPPTSSPTSLLQHATKKPVKPAKRSFDVAFLMAPDDLSKKRNHQDDKSNPIIVKKPYKYSPPSNDTGDIYHRNSYNNIEGQYQINPLSLTIHQNKLPRDDIHSPDTLIVEQKENPFFVRSAFTKVTSGTGIGGGNFQLNTSLMSRTPPIAVSPSSVSSTASNRSGLSPDLTYQDSLSPQPFQPLNRSPVQFLPGGGPTSAGKSPYHQSVLPPHNATNLQYFVAASQLGNNHLLKDIKSEDKPVKFGPGSDYEESANSASSAIPSKHKSKQLLPPSTKQNFPYHADNLSIPYTGFPMSTFPFTPTLAPAAASASVPMFPTTAANLTAALLPPSFAALTLPAQNVCAKCNMHFRMTSDLVYHMRSHHKNDTNVVDPYKRRRDQDKLKCPVCNESFRERHHLTRHMTAHQDKDEDNERNKEFVDVTLQRPISSGSAK